MSQSSKNVSQNVQNLHLWENYNRGPLAGGLLAVIGLVAIPTLANHIYHSQSGVFIKSAKATMGGSLSLASLITGIWLMKKEYTKDSSYRQKKVDELIAKIKKNPNLREDIINEFPYKNRSELKTGLKSYYQKLADQAIAQIERGSLSFTQAKKTYSDLFLNLDYFKIKLGQHHLSQLNATNNLVQVTSKEENESDNTSKLSLADVYPKFIEKHGKEILPFAKKHCLKLQKALAQAFIAYFTSAMQEDINSALFELTYTKGTHELEWARERLGYDLCQLGLIEHQSKTDVYNAFWKTVLDHLQSQKYITLKATTLTRLQTFLALYVGDEQKRARIIDDLIEEAVKDATSAKEPMTLHQIYAKYEAHLKAAYTATTGIKNIFKMLYDTYRNGQAALWEKDQCTYFEMVKRSDWTFIEKDNDNLDPPINAQLFGLRAHLKPVVLSIGNQHNQKLCSEILNKYCLSQDAIDWLGLLEHSYLFAEDIITNEATLPNSSITLERALKTSIEKEVTSHTTLTPDQQQNIRTVDLPPSKDSIPIIYREIFTFVVMKDVRASNLSFEEIKKQWPNLYKDAPEFRKALSHYYLEKLKALQVPEEQRYSTFIAKHGKEVLSLFRIASIEVRDEFGKAFVAYIQGEVNKGAENAKLVIERLAQEGHENSLLEEAKQFRLVMDQSRSSHRNKQISKTPLGQNIQDFWDAICIALKVCTLKQIAPELFTRLITKIRPPKQNTRMQKQIYFDLLTAIVQEGIASDKDPDFGKIFDAYKNHLDQTNIYKHSEIKKALQDTFTQIQSWQQGNSKYSDFTFSTQISTQQLGKLSLPPVVTFIKEQKDQKRLRSEILGAFCSDPTNIDWKGLANVHHLCKGLIDGSTKLPSSTQTLLEAFNTWVKNSIETVNNPPQQAFKIKKEAKLILELLPGLYKLGLLSDSTPHLEFLIRQYALHQSNEKHKEENVTKPQGMDNWFDEDLKGSGLVPEKIVEAVDTFNKALDKLIKEIKKQEGANELSDIFWFVNKFRETVSKKTQ